MTREAFYTWLHATDYISCPSDRLPSGDGSPESEMPKPNDKENQAQ